VPANNPWQQAIDDELVNTHLGIAQDGVTREEAKEKLNNLITWHIDVAKYFDAQAQQPTQEPVKPAGFISAKTVEWLNSIGEMIDAKMELTFRTEPSVEPYTIPFYLAPHEPVSSNEHVKQESKLQRRIDRLVKPLSMLDMTWDM